MWEANKQCHWCNCSTVWWIEGDQSNGGRPGNAATLDHLLSKFDPQRYAMPCYPSSLFVLACDRCNNRRAALEEASLRKHFTWNSKAELKKLLTTPEYSVVYKNVETFAISVK